jgi:hemerythrin-like metal-binding protein
MSLINWRDEFRIGIDAIDHEHREMIALINDLDAAMQGEASHGAVVGTLGEILARISAHFALEEKTMRNAAYAGFAAHKQDHELLLDSLSSVIDTVDTDGHYDRSALSKILDAWFSEHFRTQDAKLHQELG